MKLYLTGADFYGAEQRNGYQSLGGFQSATIVPNNRIDFLFGSLSMMTLKNKLTECVGIILFNDGVADVTNVSLKYIYDYIFKTPNYNAKFEVAAVTLIDKQRMEKISSRYDLPFDAEFYDASFRKADAIITVTAAGNIGDSVSLMGVAGTLTSNSILNVVETIVNAGLGNATFNFEKKSDNEIYLQVKDSIEYSEPITFVTDGNTTVSTSSVNLANDFDNEVIIAALLKKGEGIGLWFKRDILSKPLETNQEMYDAWKIGSEVDKKEDLEVIFSWV
jgi:hypothetical protein